MDIGLKYDNFCEINTSMSIKVKNYRTGCVLKFLALFAITEKGVNFEYS